MQQDEGLIKFVAQKNGLGLIGGTRRFSSGFMNRVYDLGGKYVLKVESDDPERKNCLRGQKALVDRLVAAGAKVPRIFEEGDYENRRYLLMEKLAGESLPRLWPKLNDSAREAILEQLAGQLRIFHGITFDSYAIRVSRARDFATFAEALRDSTDFAKINRDRLGEPERKIVAYLEVFFERNIHLLAGIGPAVFVHNDIHFENIFVEGTRLVGIIDFDRWCKAPPEYELNKIMDFFHMPAWYVEDDLQQQYQNPMEAEVRRLKKYYPTLFRVPHLLDLLRLFQVEGALWLITKYQSGYWQKTAFKSLHSVFEDFYQSDWLEKVLG